MGRRYVLRTWRRAEFRVYLADGAVAYLKDDHAPDNIHNIQTQFIYPRRGQLWRLDLG